MAMSGFICHDDYLQKTAKLTDEEIGRLFRALMRYHATGIAEEVDGRESIAFDFIREDIDKTEAAYRAKCEKNRNNRLTALVDERQRSSTSVNVPTQKEKEKDKDKDKEKDKDKDNNRRFVPPTPEEVDEYCKDRNNGIDGQYFVDYYATRNWVMTNGKKMSDWRAAVRTWEHNNRERAAPPSKGSKTVSAQQYDQRDYSGVQSEFKALQDAEIMDYLNRGAG